jgi:RNA polymerase sigma-70 factor (ECF subfamily)
VNDFELVAAAKSGDPSAFLDLHRRHVSGVQAIAWSILRDDDVDDVCQEIFLKAFVHIGSFKSNSHFRTWLTSIARRECLRVRKDSMRPTKGSHFLVPWVDRTSR